MRRVLMTLAVSAAALASAAAVSIPASAADAVQLLETLDPVPGSPLTQPNQFKKAPPWRIGYSIGGVGNTWIVQSIEEAKYEITKHKEIGDVVYTDADWKPAKQVADLEDLLTKNIDVLIVSPVTPTAVTAELEKIAARGIPIVVLGTSANTDKYTTEIKGGGEGFGKAGGDYLVKELHGTGTVWMFRGISGNTEDTDRYNGAVSAFKGTNIKIGAEVYGDWGYVKGKQLCENLVLSGKPVDGIWFSGAEMTKGCIEVFQEFKKPLVPMTGEANNGFFRVWKESGVKSIAPVFPAGLGAAAVRAAVALLEGKQLHKQYFSSPPPITEAERDKYYRPDLNDAYWFPSTLPEDKITALYAKKK